MKLIIFKKTIVKEYYYLIENYFNQEEKTLFSKTKR
jgi:hypothetical protein